MITTLAAMMIVVIMVIFAVLALADLIAPIDPAWAGEPWPSAIPDPLPEQNESSRKGAAEGAGASNINHDGEDV